MNHLMQGLATMIAGVITFLVVAQFVSPSVITGTDTGSTLIKAVFLLVKMQLRLMKVISYEKLLKFGGSLKWLYRANPMNEVGRCVTDRWGASTEKCWMMVYSGLQRMFKLQFNITSCGYRKI